MLFVPNRGFADRLRTSRISLNDRELLQLSLTDATIEDVELTRAAFPDADAPTIAIIKLSAQDVQSAVALKESLPAMTTRDLRAFLGYNITPSYVLDLRRSGLCKLTPTDVTRLNVARIDGAFVRSKTYNGRVPSVSELLKR
ncbi:MAG: hypothetical protein IAI50_06820 [Candidatus Eremiobacteraeota bacterium]|nr:hypothetical protein [Candidatus Eremiobacteraeota bacterium]